MGAARRLRHLAVHGGNGRQSASAAQSSVLLRVGGHLRRDDRRPLFATAPLITNISTTASRGRSDYKGLQASLRQRATHGLEYLASYTLGKANANQLGYYGSGGFTAAEGTYWMNAYDPEANYGPAFFEVRHNFVLSASYALPYGRDTQGASLRSAMLGGGWGGGIFQGRTGLPITILVG